MLLVIFDYDYFFGNFCFEYEWFNFVSLINEVLDVEIVLWLVYYLLKRRGL